MLLEDLFAQMERERRLEPVPAERVAIIAGLPDLLNVSNTKRYLSSRGTGATARLCKALLNRWVNAFRKQPPAPPPES